LGVFVAMAHTYRLAIAVVPAVPDVIVPALVIAAARRLRYFGL
jgi:hypothetical protein